MPPPSKGTTLTEPATRARASAGRDLARGATGVDGVSGAPRVAAASPSSAGDGSWHRPTIGCVIPAHDEQLSISRLLESLLSQTRVPDVIHVVITNTSDTTVEIASRYAGPHELVTDLGDQFTEVFVHDLGAKSDEKVGALNYGYALVEAYDYLLDVDGVAAADAGAVAALEATAASDARIGSVSAAAGRGAPARRGVFSLLSTQALRTVMALNHQATPWVRGGAAGGSLLTQQLEAAGYLTATDPTAPARRAKPLRRVASVVLPIVGAVVAAGVLSRSFALTSRRRARGG